MAKHTIELVADKDGRIIIQHEAFFPGHLASAINRKIAVQVDGEDVQAFMCMLNQIARPAIDNLLVSGGGKSGARNLPETAADFLRHGLTVLDDRGQTYDQPGGERSMGKTIAAFNIITGRDVKESEGWLMLQLLKDVRQWQKPAYHADSAVDGVNYSALKAEALARGK